MNDLPISQIRRTRFIAANYSRLQGLRIFPFGLLLFAVTYITNLQHGPAPHSVLPQILFAIAAAVLYWLIDRYYTRTFGQIVRPSRGHLDLIAGICGGAMGLVAFLIENNYHHLPFSPIGLVLAAAIIIDYLMLARITEVWYMPFWPVFALLIAIISILPVLGLTGWWTIIGARTQFMGVLMASGLIFIVYSIASHIYFIKMLSQEVPDGGSV
jgi:hypothetical protein